MSMPKDSSIKPSAAARRQTLQLFTAQMVVMMTGIASGAMTTRALGTAQYGRYSFALALVGFLGSLIGFGFAPAAARLLATLRDSTTERGFVGTVVALSAIQGLGFSALVFALGSVVDVAFSSNVRDLMAYAALLCGALPMEVMLLQVCRGTNRIGILALHTAAPKIAYTLVGFSLICFDAFDPIRALMLNYGCLAISVLAAFAAFRPDFSAISKHWGALVQESREYGFHVYLGQIADTGTYKLDSLFIGKFVDTTTVGFFSLAQTLTAPMVHLSRSLSVSLFRRFAESDRVSRRVLMANGVFLFSACFFLILSAPWIVEILFGKSYLELVRYLRPLAVAALFQGLYTPFNMFLAARRRGEELRRMSWSLAAVNLAGYSLLVPLYGASGAAIVAVVTKFTELAMNSYFYGRLVRGSAGAKPAVVI